MISFFDLVSDGGASYPRNYEVGALDAGEAGNSADEQEMPRGEPRIPKAECAAKVAEFLASYGTAEAVYASKHIDNDSVGQSGITIVHQFLESRGPGISRMIGYDNDAILCVRNEGILRLRKPLSLEPVSAVEASMIWTRITEAQDAYANNDESSDCILVVSRCIGPTWSTEEFIEGSRVRSQELLASTALRRRRVIAHVE